VGEAFFEAALKQIEQTGFIARGDASIVPAPTPHIASLEREVLEKGETPNDWSEAKAHKHYADTSCLIKNDESYFVFKSVLRSIGVTL